MKSRAAQKYTELEGNSIKIYFPKLPALVSKVKTLNSRRFYTQPSPHWTAPLNEKNVEQLIDWGFEIHPKIKKWWTLYKIPENRKAQAIWDIPGFNGQLMPFQAEGVGFYELQNGRVLNADDMGLGKTWQTLAWLQLRKADALPALIVCPATVKYMWVQEAQKLMTGVRVQVIEGRTGKQGITPNTDIVVINYDILAESQVCPKCQGIDYKRRECRACKKTGKAVELRPDLAEIEWKTVVADEFHKLGVEKTQRHRAFIQAAKSAPFRIGLTGTPIENRIIDIYRLLQIINPTIFPNWLDFIRRYCEGHHDGWGWKYNGRSNTAELNRKLMSTVMLRRKKVDVLKDLPPKTRVVIPIEVDKTLYNKVVKECTELEPIVQISKLRQAAAEAKLDSAIDWISDFLESGEKLVVFAWHKKIIDTLMKKFGAIAVKVDGSVTGLARKAAEDRFQSDPSCQLFIGNLTAAGVGLTLTAAANSCTLEYSFKPTDHSQAEDRIWRISQTRKSTAYYLMARGTIEEGFIEILDYKAAVIHAAMEGLDIEETSTIKYLMNKIGGGNEKNN